LMLCDPRIHTRSYGQMFLTALPPMRRTSELSDVQSFFASGDPTLPQPMSHSSTDLESSVSLREKVAVKDVTRVGKGNPSSS
ncbi:MAG: hypothetical protein M3461_19005, partial [Pseudomonadota bacterium]|nr:hypothetical protein [Pseudomonadota bacterium]